MGPTPGQARKVRGIVTRPRRSAFPPDPEVLARCRANQLAPGVTRTAADEAEWLERMGRKMGRTTESQDESEEQS
jgi:hypothetical protein